jgi:DNA-binding NarL/FixJ family response regulator
MPVYPERPAIPLPEWKSKVPLSALTKTELEVLRLLATPLTDKMIEERLRITERTVRFHIANIIEKTGAAQGIKNEQDKRSNFLPRMRIILWYISEAKDTPKDPVTTIALD